MEKESLFLNMTKINPEYCSKIKDKLFSYNDYISESYINKILIDAYLKIHSESESESIRINLDGTCYGFGQSYIEFEIDHINKEIRSSEIGTGYTATTKECRFLLNYVMNHENMIYTKYNNYGETYSYDYNSVLNTNKFNCNCSRIDRVHENGSVYSIRLWDFTRGFDDLVALLKRLSNRKQFSNKRKLYHYMYLLNMKSTYKNGIVVSRFIKHVYGIHVNINDYEFNRDHGIFDIFQKVSSKL